MRKWCAFNFKMKVLCVLHLNVQNFLSKKCQALFCAFEVLFICVIFIVIFTLTGMSVHVNCIYFYTLIFTSLASR